MGKNWIRRAEIIVDGQGFNMSDFDMSFAIKFTPMETPNDAEIEINNLTESTVAAHFQIGRSVIINAGYDGDIGTLFVGFITDVSNTKDDGTKTTHVLALDATEAYMRRYVSKSYREGVYALEIIQDLLRQTDLTVGEISLAESVQYPRGRMVTGKLRDVLAEIVNDCGTSLRITNGIIQIRDVGAGVETGVVLSPQTGLIGSPERKYEKDRESGMQPDYKAKCLLRHNITALSAVRLESIACNADFVVLSGKHTGSNRDDFQTEMELKLL
jgi:hypothetical protein